MQKAAAARLSPGAPPHSVEQWLATTPLPVPSTLLVLTAARARLTEGQQEHFKALAAALTPEGWQKAFLLAVRHSLPSLLWYHLATEHLEEMVPPAIWTALASGYQEKLLLQMRLVQALKQALTSCHHAGIRAIPRKGPFLALRLYGRFGPRPSNDIDLLIQPDTSQRAAYRLLAGDFEHWSAAGLQVELAWELIRRLPYRSCFPAEAIWQRALPATFEDVPCFSLRPEDELRYLCAHYAMHGLNRWLWLVDIAELLRQIDAHPAWDWSAFIAETAARELAMPAVLSFLQAQHLLDAPVPAVVIEQLGQAAQSATEQARWAALAGAAPFVRRALLLLGTESTWHERWESLAQLLWPDPDYLYDTQDYVPGHSVTRARLSRLRRLARRLLD